MTLIIKIINNIIKNIKNPIYNCNFKINFNENDIFLINNKIILQIWLVCPSFEIISYIDLFIKIILLNNKILNFNLIFCWKIFSCITYRGLNSFKKIKNIVSISSCKGGVGKSTLSVNLAISLYLQGARVGVLDADIYGPSVPILLGINDKPKSIDNMTMEPIIKYGIESNSIGFLINFNSPAIWRGPIASQAIQQILNNTNWLNLDYLFIDMPPGTGDISLTLSQKTPIIGTIVITTPQNIALYDVNKNIRMFNKIGVSILGLIENMSMYVCDKCFNKDYIFGNYGGKNISKQYKIKFLGKIPILTSIRKYSDLGQPIVTFGLKKNIVKIFFIISRNIISRIFLLPKYNSETFQNIIINKKLSDNFNR